MKRLVFSPLAAQDLNDIFDWIVVKNPIAAAKTIQSLEQTCRLLAQQPGLGAACDDLRLGMRLVAHKSFVIFYMVTDAAVEIVRVVRGSRDLPSLFTP